MEPDMPQAFLTTDELVQLASDVQEIRKGHSEGFQDDRETT